jgi:hypothetical protein
MDALYQAQRGGLASNADAWALQQAFLAHLAEIWREPDRGIWESRQPPRHFTFSKVMAWVAFDRGAKIARQFGLHGPVERWSKIAKEIHDDVCTNGYDDELGSFVQSYGSKWLDGSLLLIPTTSPASASLPSSGRGTLRHKTWTHVWNFRQIKRSPDDFIDSGDFSVIRVPTIRWLLPSNK